MYAIISIQSQFISRKMIPEYSFPAIRGIQAEQEYYVCMFPIRLIPKLFSFNDEEVPPDMRAQRTLNRARIPEIARYILENPKSYVFSAITASIKAKINFESIGSEPGIRDIGRLRIPLDARFVINDGQHRRAAFEVALKENPKLGDESIAVVFFVDIGLKRSQQIFTDLNRYTSHPDSSLNILYDSRDKKSILAKAVMNGVKVFKSLTETERSNLSIRSCKLFTLSGLYQANKALLVYHKSVELEEQIFTACQFWESISTVIPDWEQVLHRKVSASEIRRDYIHSHSVALQGLGGAGASLMAFYPNDWQKHLNKLSHIDWSRSNPDWEGRIISGGQVSKSRVSVSFMTGYLKQYLGLPLSTDEERLQCNDRCVICVESNNDL